MNKMLGIGLIGSLGIGVVIGFCSMQMGNISKSNNKVSTSNNVEKVLNEQINITDLSIEKEDTVKQNKIENKKEDKIENTSLESIDIDLTQMSSDMVYATVYQFMINPKTYIGKTIKMSGVYSPVFYKPTQLYYHYCIIQDATACCAQGMEFVWDDGEHVYPDEYPEENAIITVTGIFETYHEDGDETLYCRLKNAQLNVEK